jgi:hypothetical protein
MRVASEFYRSDSMTPVKASKALLGREVKASQVDYEIPYKILSLQNIFQFGYRKEGRIRPNKCIKVSTRQLRCAKARSGHLLNQEVSKQAERLSVDLANPRLG